MQLYTHIELLAAVMLERTIYLFVANLDKMKVNTFITVRAKHGSH